MCVCVCVCNVQIPVVRVHAVAVLQFFQVEEADCPVVAKLLELMEKDSSPEVRRCVLNNIVTIDPTLAGEYIQCGGQFGGGGGDGEDCVLDNGSFIDRMMRIMNGEGRGIGDERLRIS